MKTLGEIKIEAAIRECDSHCAVLEKASTALAAWIPFTIETFPSLPDEAISRLDQFIFRLTKLQDAMGLRLFPALAGVLSGNDDPRPFLDVLNLLEKNGVIPSAQEWQVYRAIRNNLAHEYPDDITKTVLHLNTVMREWRGLVNIFIRVREYWAGKR